MKGTTTGKDSERKEKVKSRSIVETLKFIKHRLDKKKKS